MDVKDLYFTITEAAKELGVSRQTISRLIAQGKLTAETVGREKLIEKKKVKELLKLDATRTAKKVISMMAETIKKKYYSEDDKIRAVGDDFIVTKRDGTMERVETPEIKIAVNDETGVITFELTKIIRTPYKGKGKKKGK